MAGLKGSRSMVWPAVLCLVAHLACAQMDAGRTATTAGDEEPTNATSSEVADPAAEVVLGLGEKTTLGDLTLTWTEVEDSRCPVDVQCVWEGRVVVTLEVSVGEQDTQTLRLTNHPDGLRDEQNSDLAESLRLVEVEPYPRSDQPTEESEYRATIRLREP